MICISIAQESRRMALADMVNAAKQCDLLEVRLDRFAKAAEVGEMLAAKPKPVIMSCRRPQDGGAWQGSEDDRLAILRQCIISKADFVEIELDVADQIRRMPSSRRIISYYNFKETPDNIADIYAAAQSKGADVVKLVTLARTPEEAWPLVQILAKPAVPTVVIGLGKPGLMLTILGRKIGAPFVYAALERGMEGYPGQPTVSDLEKVYHYNAINRTTRLIGVTGFTNLDVATIAGLNTAFEHLGIAMRCLPLQVGSMKIFRKIIEGIKLGGVVVDEVHREAILEIAREREPAADRAKVADLIVSEEGKWHAYNLLGHAGTKALETTVAPNSKVERPLEGKQVMIVGVNAPARALAFGTKWRGGIPIIASRDHKAANALAQVVECRFLPQFEALYSTMHDVLVVCSEERQSGKARDTDEGIGIHTSYLKEGMTVMDLTTMPRKSALLREAETRGCKVVSPREVLLQQLVLQARLLTGKDVPFEPLIDVLQALVQDEE